MDVDIIIEDDMEKIDRVLESLREENFDVLMDQARIGFSMNENVPVFDNASVLRLDLKIARSPEEKEVIDDARLESISGVPVQVASVEDILFGKVWFIGEVGDLRDAELLEFNDVLDFVNVFLAHDRVDMSRLREKVKRKNLEAMLDRLLALARQIREPSLA